jgi:hypothetical protein
MLYSKKYSRFKCLWRDLQIFQPIDVKTILTKRSVILFCKFERGELISIRLKALETPLYMTSEAAWVNKTWLKCFDDLWAFPLISVIRGTENIARINYNRVSCHLVRQLAKTRLKIISLLLPLIEKWHRAVSHKLTVWRRIFFLILKHPVYKKWIIQEPNTLELWNKLRFQEEKTESIHHV